MAITSEQLRAARALLDMKQSKLAELSGVSVPTIKRLEARKGTLTAHSKTLDDLTRCLNDMGVIFIDENGDGPGVRLRKQPSEG